MQPSWHHLSAIVATAAGLTLALCASVPAHAQVYQVDDDGGVRVRSGGGAVDWIDPNALPDLSAASDGTTPAPLPPEYAGTIQRVSAQYGLSPDLLEAVIWQESRWHPGAVSPKGALSLMQLMPDTARQLGVDPRDPHASIEGGAHYLRQLLDKFDGNVELALAAYNSGPARVQRVRRIPNIPETRAYVASIIGRLSYRVEQ